MTHLFRTIAPKRTCTKKYSDYHKYKDALSEDFNHKCGYTDCSERWFGGKRTFQIDHLKPKSKHPGLIHEYSNLVYCCAYVNRAKWHDDSPNYLDPCNVDFNTHFERDDNGFIMPKTLQGKYMVEHLQLDLYRYAIIWNLDRLSEKIDKLNEITNRSGKLKRILFQLYEEYYKYTKYLVDK
jgi:HNH endonuclease, putative